VRLTGFDIQVNCFHVDSKLMKQQIDFVAIGRAGIAVETVHAAVALSSTAIRVAGLEPLLKESKCHMFCDIFDRTDSD
jgi:hypothetical protein